MFGGVAAFAFVLYLWTMPHWVTMEDSGEFIVSALKLGIPHPPGYPLWTWIAHLFTWFPFGSVAVRVHVFSALCGSLACGFVFLSALRVGIGSVASIGAGLLFAVSHTFWSQSIIAEVYALNALFFFALLWMALGLRQNFSRRGFLEFAFVFGLSMSNHWPILVLSSVAFVLLLWPHRKEVARSAPLACLVFFAGLLPYLLLFLSHGDYGFLGPIRSLRELWDYVLRKEYATDDVQPFATPWDQVLLASNFLKELTVEFGPLVFPFMAAGSVLAWKRLGTKVGRGVWFALLGAFLSTSFFLLALLRFEFNLVTVDIFEVFYIVPFGVATVWAAIGLEAFASIISKKFAVSGRTVTTGLVALVIIQAMAWNWRSNDQHKDSFAFDFAKLVLESLPENAVFLTWADADVGPFAYTHIAADVRPDVLLTTQTGVIHPEKIFDRRRIRSDHERAEKTVERIQHWLDEGRRVFASRRLYLFAPGSRERFPFQYRPHWLYEEITRATEPPVAHPELTQKAIGILDRVARSDYASTWRYHRNFLINRLCRLVVFNGLQHSLFQTNRECKLMYVEKLREHEQNFQAADPLLEQILDESTNLPVQDQVEAGRLFLINRLTVISKFGGDGPARMRDFQKAIDRVEPLAYRMPSCANSLALALLEARSQVELKLDMSRMRALFGTCPKHLSFMKRIKGSN